MLGAIRRCSSIRILPCDSQRIPFAKLILSGVRSFTNEPKSPVRHISPLVRLQYIKGNRDFEGEGLVRRLRGRVRLLRRQAVTTRSDRRPKSGSEPRTTRRERHEVPDQEWSDSAIRRQRTALNDALAGDDLEAVRVSYKAALPLISAPCTKSIAQLLHQSCRQAQGKDDLVPSLLQFASEMVSDLRSGKLAPHPWAIIHLLGIFKESGRFEEGIALWNFIVGKDHRYIIQSTYGAMIELLAERGDSLASLEELYKLGLKSYNGTFAEYHFAHNAIVKDRSKRVIAQKLPLALLQGIYVARLKHGDVQNAYLALDTVLRLAIESIPHRFFQLPIFTRPAFEGYVTFILACRMGINLGPGPLRILLSKMNGVLNEPPRDASYFDFIREKQNGLRAMLSATVSYAAIGGELNVEHQRALYAGIAHAIWNKASSGHLGEHAQAAKAMESMLLSIAELFSQQSIPLDPYAFSSMIAAASRAGTSSVDALLQSLSSFNFDPNVYAYQAILLAAGEEKDIALLQQSWQYLLEMPHETPHSRNRSWWSLARACKLADCVSYAREEMDRKPFAIPLDTQARERCLGLLQEPPREANSPRPYLTSKQAAAIAEENWSLQRLIAESITWLKSGKLFTEDFPYTFILNDSLGYHISDQCQRAVYDKVTAESAIQDSQSDLNSLGIPLDKLRFENWKWINELIYQSMYSDSQHTHRSPPSTEEEAKETIFKLRCLV
ncbi:MAG: hypothetical protein M1821_002179 [Bathelium mastoideum]|nr:MAG: hypothetical protein M1821_002179 [Bathelium mastoideum]